MTTNKYNMGDLVFWATAGTTSKYVTCPDCFGKQFLTVIMGDGTQHTIDCECCREGLVMSRGQVTTWEFAAEVHSGTVSGIEADPFDRVQWRYQIDNHRVDETDIRTTREAAEIRANELVTEHTAHEAVAFQQKYKEHKNWQWHVSYHRKELKRAEDQIKYHTAKLSVAQAKTKEATHA